MMMMYMDKALETLVGTAPSAVAVIVVVVLFLKHLEARDILLRALHAEHEDSRKASRGVIEENTRILGEHLELSREVSEVLREVSENIKFCQLKRNE
jgi:hypothetical protein